MLRCTPQSSTHLTVVPKSALSLGLMLALFGAPCTTCSSLYSSLLCLQQPPCSLPCTPSTQEEDPDTQRQLPFKEPPQQAQKSCPELCSPLHCHLTPSLQVAPESSWLVCALEWLGSAPEVVFVSEKVLVQICAERMPGGSASNPGQ